MSLPTKIKIGSVSNLTDARFAASQDVSWIGFNFSENSESYINPVDAQGILGWISGPDFVAEFDHHNWDKISDITNLLGISWVQIPFSNQFLSNFNHDLNLIVELQLDEFDDVMDMDNFPNSAWLLIKNASLGLLETLPQSIFEKLIIDLSHFKNEDLELLKERNPFAIQINGGIETQPGLKDVSDLSEIIELFNGEYLW